MAEQNPALKEETRGESPCERQKLCRRKSVSSVLLVSNRFVVVEQNVVVEQVNNAVMVEIRSRCVAGRSESAEQGREIFKPNRIVAARVAARQNNRIARWRGQGLLSIYANIMEDAAEGVRFFHRHIIRSRRNQQMKRAIRRVRQSAQGGLLSAAEPPGLFPERGTQT